MPSWTDSVNIPPYTGLDRNDSFPGRQARVAARLIYKSLRESHKDPDRRYIHIHGNRKDRFLSVDKSDTFREVVDKIQRFRNLKAFKPMYDALDNLPLRSIFYGKPLSKIDSLPRQIEIRDSNRDPELHVALQDLGWQIAYDLKLACESINDRNVYYPGVDEGIEPVTDDHVLLVIRASQRELNRETQVIPGTTIRRPPVPLEDILPKNIQRAFAERRRLRYKQWGITRENYDKDSWSLWKVSEDKDWIPPWLESP